MSVSENSTVREPIELLDEHSFMMEDLAVTASSKSPYTDQTLVALDVGATRTRFLLHRSLLEQSSELSAKADAIFLWSDKTKVVQLPDLEESTAHTLVHYLYTGVFQTLRLDGQPNEGMLEGFKLGTCVYCAATRYKIPGLASLAKDKITFCGDSLSILDILTISRESAFPVLPEDEAWFPTYLETAINDAFTKDLELFTKPEFSDQIEGDRRYRQVVLKAMTSALTRRPITPKPVPSKPLESAVEPKVEVSSRHKRHDSGTSELHEGLTTATNIEEASADKPHAEEIPTITTETNTGVEPIFDAIEPVEEAPAKPEPVTDETGWGESTTYKNMGKKPKKESVSDEVPAVKETETAISAPELVERQESQASNDSNPSVEVPNTISPESVAPPPKKKKNKKKKAAKVADGSVANTAVAVA